MLSGFCCVTHLYVRIMNELFSMRIIGIILKSTDNKPQSHCHTQPQERSLFGEGIMNNVLFVILELCRLGVVGGLLAYNEQGLLQGWNSLLVRPEPLLIKDIKVQVDKQKPSNVSPAQMKHNSDKMTIAPMSCRLAANRLLAVVVVERILCQPI